MNTNAPCRGGRGSPGQRRMICRIVRGWPLYTPSESGGPAGWRQIHGPLRQRNVDRSKEVSGCPYGPGDDGICVPRSSSSRSVISTSSGRARCIWATSRSEISRSGLSPSTAWKQAWRNRSRARGATYATGELECRGPAPEIARGQPVGRRDPSPASGAGRSHDHLGSRGSCPCRSGGRTRASARGTSAGGRRRRARLTAASNWDERTSRSTSPKRPKWRIG